MQGFCQKNGRDIYSKVFDQIIAEKKSNVNYLVQPCLFYHGFKFLCVKVIFFAGLLPGMSAASLVADAQHRAATYVSDDDLPFLVGN